MPTNSKTIGFTGDVTDRDKVTGRIHADGKPNRYNDPMAAFDKKVRTDRLQSRGCSGDQE